MPRILSIGRLKIKNKNMKAKDRKKIKINEKKKDPALPHWNLHGRKINYACLHANSGQCMEGLVQISGENEVLKSRKPCKKNKFYMLACKQRIV